MTPIDNMQARAIWATSMLPEATRMHPTGTTPKRSVGSIANMAFMGIRADLYQASVSFSNSEMSLRKRAYEESAWLKVLMTSIPSMYSTSVELTRSLAVQYAA